MDEEAPNSAVKPPSRAVINGGSATDRDCTDEETLASFHILDQVLNRAFRLDGIAMIPINGNQLLLSGSEER